MSVDVFSWNPRRPVFRGRMGRLLPYPRKRVNNFGDLLGPALVARLLRSQGLETVIPRRNITLFSVGSVLHFARTGDVIWGTGRNGKISQTEHHFEDLDVRAVRGPLSAEFLRNRGIHVPDIYGDPGILTARLFPELAPSRPAGGIIVVPNLNDLPEYRRAKGLLDPRTDLQTCLRVIANSDLVVGSSLHAIIVAESFGVPARLIASSNEPRFKYADYYLGTRAVVPEIARSVDEAVRMGGAPLPSINPDGLIAAFPFDLWRE